MTLTEEELTEWEKNAQTIYYGGDESPYPNSEELNFQNDQILKLIYAVRKERRAKEILLQCLDLIGGTCGVPNASEACRIILKRRKEALAQIKELE